MKSLILKDMITIKKMAKSIAYIFLVPIVFMIIGNDNQTFMCSYLIMMGSILVNNTISYDEFNHGLSYMMTLPLNRQQYVYSKYVVGLMLLCGFGLIGLIITCGMSLIQSSLLESSELLFFFIIMLLLGIFLMSINIPLHLKFGGEKGRMMGIAVYLTIFIAVMVVAKLVSLFNVNTVSILKFLVGLNQFQALLVVGVLVIIMMLISIKISERIMLKKEF